MRGTNEVHPHFYAGRQSMEFKMRLILKRFGIVALAGMSIVGASLASANPAEARWRDHHHHRHHSGWGWGGPVLIGGLALGTASSNIPDGPCLLLKSTLSPNRHHHETGA